MGLASSLRSRNLSRLESPGDFEGVGTGLDDEPGVGLDEEPVEGAGEGLDDGSDEGSDDAVGVGDGLGSGLGSGVGEGLGEGVGSGSSGGGVTSHSPAASVMAARRVWASAVFPAETAFRQAVTWTA